MSRPEAVRYHNPGEDTVYEARRLRRSQIGLHAAHRILHLLDRSYTAQFETGDFEGWNGGPVPAGTMHQWFAPQKEQARQKYLEDMQKSVDEQGSTYWYVALPNTSIGTTKNVLTAMDAPIALAKVTASRASELQKAHLSKPNCYLNAIVVDPEWQHNIQAQVNVGALALHAALKYSGFGLRKTLALDAFQGNQGPNEWFGRMGLQIEPQAEVEPFDAGNDVLLPMQRMTSQRGHNLKTHINYLERAHPILVTAEAA